MAITKSIGKNTLGSGNKMTVDLRTYNRSTHNLSYAWRSTMGVGTLVPCMKILAKPGDTFDINIDKKVLTHPTVGPLFGSYKMQVDIFTCPLRLYISALHNNMLNVGLNMKNILFPKISITLDSKTDTPTADDPWPMVHPSCVMSYLGFKGYTGQSVDIPDNALPLLSYLDIFKNYYANKQEENFYAIMPQNADLQYTEFNFEKTYNQTEQQYTYNVGLKISSYQGLSTTYQDATQKTQISVATGEVVIENGRRVGTKKEWMTISEFISLIGATGVVYDLTANVLSIAIANTKSKVSATIIKDDGVKFGEAGVTLQAYELSTLDDLREMILSTPFDERFSIGQGSSGNVFYLRDLFQRGTGAGGTRQKMNTSNPQAGLLLKTYQSDVFNNWINTEWIDGDNGISAITAIDTSSGEFTIDTLNLAKKVYDMLNRIAVSGGSYRDWIETVYTGGYMMHTETPVYEGGMSCEIEFQEVVSNSATEDEPLGTLAGRGVSTTQKGGNLHIKVSEPAYIIGIVSITPRIDYCQGNDWDLYLKNMDDIHKPALDGIGYQDLTENLMAWWRPANVAVGKQPAWINYMTNFNKTFGNFAIEGNEAFMVLNRYYDPKDGDYSNEIDYTTYIDPRKYNYIFADTSLSAENFWVQLGFGIKARRIGSAKQIPNL